MAELTIVDQGKEVLIQTACGTHGYRGPQYIAVGDDDTPINETDTTMNGERARAIITGPIPAGNSCILTVTFPKTAANFTWKNAALFGNGATSAIGSGTMIGAVVLDAPVAKDPSNSEQMSITLTFP